jgi:hypothetical protein
MGKSEGGAVVLLGCDTVSIGSWWSKFWDRLVTPYSSFVRTDVFLKVSKQLFLFDAFFTNCISICAGNVSDQALCQKTKIYDTHVTTRTKISTNYLVKRNFSARCLLSVEYPNTNATSIRSCGSIIWQNKKIRNYEKDRKTKYLHL